MSIGAMESVAAVGIGLGATLIMDLWNLLLKLLFGIRSLNYCLLGRWFRHMPQGTFRHPSIAAAAKKPHECLVGRIAHYSIGAALALVFIALMPGNWLEHPTLPPALLYGIATVVFPFFIMQPSLGLGVASSRTPHPSQARMKSLATHFVFGVGLYLCGIGVRSMEWLSRC